MDSRSAADCMKVHPPRSRTPRFRPHWLHTVTTFAEGRSRLSGWLTFLCLSLVLLCGTIQAEHVHPSSPGNTDTHAACSLCVTAHVGVETSAAPLPHHAAVVLGAVEPRIAPTDHPAPRNFDLYTRPPPTSRS